MNRLLAFNKLTTESKKKNKDIDIKLGFHSVTNGSDKYYPENGGVGRWVEILKDKLIHNNIEIKTNSIISKIEVRKNTFIVTVNDKDIEIDELVWTLSSGLLNRFINTGKVVDKPNFRKTAIYDFIFDCPLKTDSYYINVYDKDFLSTRITAYQNLQTHKTFYACSVEALNDFNFDFEHNIKNIEQELFKIGLIEKDNKCIFSQCRILKV